MIRGLLMAIGVVAIIVGAGGVGFALGRARGRRQAAELGSLRELRLQEHRRLLSEARDATERGELGVADMLAAAAERVLEPTDLPPATGGWR